MAEFDRYKNQLNDRALQKLGRLDEIINRNIERKLATKGALPTTGNRLVRFAKTVSYDFPYPSGSSYKYEIILGKPIWDNTTLDEEEIEFEAFGPDGSGEFVRIMHCLEKTDLEEGDLVQVALHDSKWHLISGAGGAGQEIIFVIDEIYGADEEGGEHCDEKNRDAKSSYKAEIINASCGLDQVPGLEDDGKVIVHDELGSFLEGREEYEVAGKTGIASYFKNYESDGGTAYSEDCKWIITWIDWFREVQVITDVQLTEDELKFEVKNIVVWDDCKLDPIIIPLIDCE